VSASNQTDGEESFELGLVDFALVIKLLEEFADNGFVARLGSADEVVIGDVERGAKGAKPSGNFIAILLR